MPRCGSGQPRALSVGSEAISVITTLALTALFESIQVLEDSFVAFLTLDGIDVQEEFEVLHWQQLIRTRQLLFPNAPPYQQGTRKSKVIGNVEDQGRAT